MIKEYLGNEITKYTLTSGSELTLSKEELKDLIEESPLVEDLEDEVEDLKSDVESLQKELKHYEKEVDILNKEISRLEQQI